MSDSCGISLYQLNDMRVCGKVSKPCMSRHARYWVASLGFRSQDYLHNEGLFRC